MCVEKQLVCKHIPVRNISGKTTTTLQDNNDIEAGTTAEMITVHGEESRPAELPRRQSALKRVAGNKVSQKPEWRRGEQGRRKATQLTTTNSISRTVLAPRRGWTVHAASTESS